MKLLLFFFLVTIEFIVFFVLITNTWYFARQIFQLMDQDMDRSLTFEEYLVVMSMLSWGSLDEKLQWVFNLYDSNGDGQLTTDKLTDVVSLSTRCWAHTLIHRGFEITLSKPMLPESFRYVLKKTVFSQINFILTNFLFFLKWTVIRTAFSLLRSSRSIASTWV